MPVTCRGRRAGGFHLSADKFGQGVAEVSGEIFHLGAGFRLLPILIGGDRVLNDPASIARRGRGPQLTEGWGRGGKGC